MLELDRRETRKVDSVLATHVATKGVFQGGLEAD